MKEVKLEESAYQFNAKMSLKQAIPLGLQHVCAMFVGNLTPLLIITSACGIAGGEFADLQVTLLQSAMFVAGVVTLVQLFTIGPVGGSGHQFRFYRRVQQCCRQHGRRCAGLWCHYGCIHHRRHL